MCCKLTSQSTWSVCFYTISQVLNRHEEEIFIIQFHLVLWFLVKYLFIIFQFDTACVLFNFTQLQLWTTVAYLQFFANMALPEILILTCCLRNSWRDWFQLWSRGLFLCQRHLRLTTWLWHALLLSSNIWIALTSCLAKTQVVYYLPKDPWPLCISSANIECRSVAAQQIEKLIYHQLRG